LNPSILKTGRSACHRLPLTSSLHRRHRLRAQRAPAKRVRSLAPLRHARLVEALASFEVGWIVAYCFVAGSVDNKVRINCKPARTAAFASSNLPRRARAAARAKCELEFRLASIPRLSQVTASASAPSCNWRDRHSALPYKHVYQEERVGALRRCEPLFHRHDPNNTWLYLS